MEQERRFTDIGILYTFPLESFEDTFLIRYVFVFNNKVLGKTILPPPLFIGNLPIKGGGPLTVSLESGDAKKKTIYTKSSNLNSPFGSFEPSVKTKSRENRLRYLDVYLQLPNVLV